MPDSINQIPKVAFDGVDPVHQQWLYQMADAVNGLLGYSGEIPLQNHINLKNNRIMNLGAPVEATDALSSAVAEASYSAPALKPKLQSGGSSVLDTYRILNNSTQREQTSSHLNDVLSIVPSANAIVPTLTNGGSSCTVSIPSAEFTFADGSTTMLEARTDILSYPEQFAISSISGSGLNVTVDCAASGLVAGEVATISGASAAGNNGSFTLTSSTSGGAVIGFQNPNASPAGAGGYVQVNGVYYYAAKKRSQYVNLFGPFSGDTALNRMQVNFDSSQIVAVVVVTAGGGQVAQSGGGGSPLTGAVAGGSFF